MTQYEEFHDVPQIYGWAILIVFCLAIIGWGFFNYFMIPDTPRDWNLGQVPDVPGQSVYSTGGPEPGMAPPQLEGLPPLVPAPATPPELATQTMPAPFPRTTQPQSQPSTQSGPAAESQTGGRP